MMLEPWVRTFHFSPALLKRIDFEKIAEQMPWYYSRKTRIYIRPLPEFPEVSVTVEGIADPIVYGGGR
jgi:hypothetical protein